MTEPEAERIVEEILELPAGPRILIQALVRKELAAIEEGMAYAPRYAFGSNMRAACASSANRSFSIVDMLAALLKEYGG